MAFEVKMPQLGLTMEEGTVSKWIKHEGDAVKVGDVILEITTDKLTNEVASEAEGTLLKIVAQEGEDVPVKGTLAWIGQPGEAVGGGAPAAPAAAPAVPFAPAAAAATAAPVAPAKPAGDTSVIVIGGGPGGYVAAIRAAQLGAKVTVVEKQYLGGTCLNVGCIPTKCLLHSAELVEDIRNQGKEIGVEVEGVKVNFPQVIAHKNEISKKLTSGVAGLLKMNKVKKVDGEASFIGEKKLSVKKPDGSTEEMTADAIIVATGSVNSVPPIPGIKENPNCIDSTGALSLEALPKSMVVIGGGVIGLELACAYAAFGTKITVVEAMDHMLPMLDGDLTKIGVAHMKKMGMEFNLECPVQSVESSPVGAKVVCKNKAGETASLNLEAGKIENDRGRIIVNDRMETSVPGVYAIGDCNGKLMLAHTAYREAEVAVNHMLGVKDEMRYNVIPSVIYTDPEVASVGETADSAKAKGLNVKEVELPMLYSGRYVAENENGKGFIKLVVDTSKNCLIGCHMVGSYASEIIMTAAMMVDTELPPQRLKKLVFPHPTVGEIIREAMFKI